MIPKYLSIKNFLSHDSSVIDFDQFKVALILGSFDGELDQSNGAGKCLSENTIITNAITGERIKIKDINNIDNLFVNGLGEDLKLSPSKVVALQKSGIKEMLKITMSNGRSEIVSETHPILTDSLTTKSAKYVNNGDFIACPRFMHVSSSKGTISKKLARVLAMRLSEEKGISQKLPRVIFGESKENVSAFLGMLWLHDGFVSNVVADGRKEISIGSRSELLIDDIQVLLQRFGILSLKKLEKIKAKYDHWTLNVGTYHSNVVQFCELMGDNLVGFKKSRLDEIIHYNAKCDNSKIDIIPNSLLSEYVTEKKDFMWPKDDITLKFKHPLSHSFGRDRLNSYANILMDKYLRKLANSDLIWLRVKLIEKIGKQQTYDIQIDNSTKLYALNGFITHNSAIFESISWALFDKSRHKKKDGVIKNDKRSCEVTFDFLIEDKLYRIKRSRDKVIGGADVSFMLWDGSRFNDISCDTKTATDKKIASTISVNYDVFVNSVYFKQKDISMFATSAPNKRKDTLKSLLKMEKWDAYHKKAKDKAKVLLSQIEAKSLNTISLDNIEEKAEECKVEIEKLKKFIKSKNKEFSRINNNLVAKKLELNSIGDININEELKNLKKELKTDQKRLDEIRKQRETNNKSIEYGNSQVSIIDQKIRSLKGKIKLAKGIDIDFLRLKTSQGESKEKLLKDKILTLEKKLDLNGECNVCKKPLTKNEIITITKRREKELVDLKTKHNIIKEKLQRAVEKLKEKDLIVSEASKAEIDKGKQDLKIVKLRNTIHDCEISNERIDSEQSLIKSKNLKSRISKIQSLVDSNGIENLKSNISNIEKQLIAIKKTIDKLNIEYGSKVRKMQELNKIEKEQIQLQKDIVKIKNEHAVLDKLKNYFSKEGIQSVIIENVIEELENYTNDTLTKICNDPMSVSIKTQKQNDNGSWTETFDIDISSGSRTDDFETYSGGEGFRVSLALRLALSNILATRMGGVLKFLLLDEVSSSLDNKGIEMFIDIVKKLSEDMKILIITHDEKLKDKLESVIIVNKDVKGSKAELK